MGNPLKGKVPSIQKHGSKEPKLKSNSTTVFSLSLNLLREP